MKGEADLALVPGGKTFETYDAFNFRQTPRDLRSRGGLVGGYRRPPSLALNAFLWGR